MNTFHRFLQLQKTSLLKLKTLHRIKLEDEQVSARGRVCITTTITNENLFWFLIFSILVQLFISYTRFSS